MAIDFFTNNAAVRQNSVSSTGVSYSASRLTASEIKTFLMNDPLPLTALRMRASDATDNWLTVVADNEAVSERVSAFLDDYGVQAVIEEAYFLSLAYGIALLVPHTPPENPAWIEIIHPADITNIHTKEGEVTSYEVTTDGLARTITADNVIALRNRHFLPIGEGGEWGLSALQPIAHMVKFKINLEWGIANTIFRSGSPVPVGKAPSTLTATEYTAFKENFKNINALKSIALKSTGVKDDDFEFSTLFTGSNIADHSKTLNLIYSQIAAGLGVSRQLLLGVEAGQVTGSETNLKNYYSNISSYQTSVLEPAIRSLIFAFTKETEYNIVWTPLFELSEVEQAEAMQKRAQAFGSAASAIAALRQVGINAGLDKDGNITIDNEPVPGMTVNKTKEEQAYEEQAKVEYAKYAPPWLMLEQKAYDRSIPYYAEFKKQSLALLDKVQATGIFGDVRKGLLGKIKDRIAAGDKAIPGEVWEILNSYSLRISAIMKDWSKHQTDLYQYGLQLTDEQFDLGIDFENVGDAELADIAAESRLVWNKVGEDILYNVRHDIAEGIRTGKGYNDIAKSIMETVDGIKASRAMLIARTETHNIVIKARGEAYRRAGVDEFTYYTAGDERVRPTHADMEGGPRTYEECIRFLSEPNCRCDIRPYRHAGIMVAPEIMRDRPIGPAAQQVLYEEGVSG